MLLLHGVGVSRGWEGCDGGCGNGSALEHDVVVDEITDHSTANTP
jgi:hypothetical protein